MQLVKLKLLKFKLILKIVLLLCVINIPGFWILVFLKLNLLNLFVPSCRSLSFRWPWIPGFLFLFPGSSVSGCISFESVI